MLVYRQQQILNTRKLKNLSQFKLLLLNKNQFSLNLLNIHFQMLPWWTNQALNQLNSKLITAKVSLSMTRNMIHSLKLVIKTLNLLNLTTTAIMIIWQMQKDSKHVCMVLLLRLESQFSRPHRILMCNKLCKVHQLVCQACFLKQRQWFQKRHNKSKKPWKNKDKNELNKKTYHISNNTINILISNKAWWIRISNLQSRKNYKGKQKKMPEDRNNNWLSNKQLQLLWKILMLRLMNNKFVNKIPHLQQLKLHQQPFNKTEQVFKPNKLKSSSSRLPWQVNRLQIIHCSRWKALLHCNCNCQIHN